MGVHIDTGAVYCFFVLRRFSGLRWSEQPAISPLLTRGGSPCMLTEDAEDSRGEEL